MTRYKYRLILLLIPMVLGGANGQEAKGNSKEGSRDLIPKEQLPPEASAEKQAASKKLYEEGLAVEKSKDLDGAIAKWKQALQTDPRNAACMNHYAWFLAVTAPKERKDLDQALALARRSALITELKNYDVLDTVAEIHYLKKEFKLAVAVQKLALKIQSIGKGKRRYLLKQLKKFETAAGKKDAGSEQ